jgi:hypothetical protein
MRILITVYFLLMVVQMNAQPSSFPDSFVGNWKGMLTWNRPGKQPQEFTMRLNIQPVDSGRYTWQIVYGDNQQDNRPYLLMPVDTAKGHWQVDERNTIMLDSYVIGNVFSSVFSVSGSTIVSKYELTKEGLLVSFTTFATKAVTTTGGTSTEVPPVDSYKILGLQQGLLKRVAN